MSLALFDLDRTLIDGYAYARLMPELWRRGIRRTGLMRLVSRLVIARATSRAPLSSWWPQAFASYLGGLAATDVAQACAVAAERVRAAVRKELQQELETRRAAGDELWLVTATVHPLAEPVAAALGFEECLSTQVAAADGRFERFLAGPVCRGQEKLARVRQRLLERGLPDDLSSVSYYADGKEDLPLLAAVGQAIAVCPDAGLAPIARSRGFRILGAPRAK
ncbi:MAG: HAD family hydrolase [Thermaerobacter sp.]|nr:HAD family hydrolase [Thermaerobacter sp.]